MTKKQIDLFGNRVSDYELQNKTKPLYISKEIVKSIFFLIEKEKTLLNVNVGVIIKKLQAIGSKNKYIFKLIKVFKNLANYYHRKSFKVIYSKNVKIYHLIFQKSTDKIIQFRCIVSFIEALLYLHNMAESITEAWVERARELVADFVDKKEIAEYYQEINDKFSSSGSLMIDGDVLIANVEGHQKYFDFPLNLDR